MRSIVAASHWSTRCRWGDDRSEWTAGEWTAASMVGGKEQLMGGASCASGTGPAAGKLRMQMPLWQQPPTGENCP